MTQPKSNRDIPAVILCGGRSRRMGMNKAELRLGNESALARIERTFAEFANPLFVVIGHDSPVPELKPSTQIIRDENADFGPMEGLRIGLKTCAPLSELVYLGTCDAPLIEPDAYRYLRHRIEQEPNYLAAIPRIDDHLYPLTGVYSRKALGIVQTMVAVRQLRLRDLMIKIRVLEIDAEEIRPFDANLNTVKNMNTREDYQWMLQQLSDRDSATQQNATRG